MNSEKNHRICSGEMVGGDTISPDLIRWSLEALISLAMIRNICLKVKVNVHVFWITLPSTITASVGKRSSQSFLMDLQDIKNYNAYQLV